MNKETRVYIVNRESFIWSIAKKIQRFILFSSTLSVILIISYSAFMRYIFKKDFYGIEDITLIVAFWMYFIGGAYGSYTKNHVSAEVIPIYMKNKYYRNIVIIIKSIITVALSWVLTYWALNLMIWGIQKFGKTPSLGIPLVVPQSAIFIGLLIMSVYTTIYLVEDVLIFRKNKTTDLLMDKEVV